MRNIQELFISSVYNWQARDLERMFQAMMKLPRLKKLDLKCLNLPSLEPELFARVVARLEDVKLEGTKTTDVQIQTLFTAMAQDTGLKKLDFSLLNLSSLEPQLLQGWWPGLRM